MPCPLPRATSREPRSRSTTASPHKTRAPRLGLAAGTGCCCFTAKTAQGLPELTGGGLPEVRKCRHFLRTPLKGGESPLFSPHLPCLWPGWKTGKTSSASSSRDAGTTRSISVFGRTQVMCREPARPPRPPPSGWVYPGKAPGNLAVGSPSGE